MRRPRRERVEGYILNRAAVVVTPSVGAVPFDGWVEPVVTLLVDSADERAGLTNEQISDSLLSWAAQTATRYRR